MEVGKMIGARQRDDLRFESSDGKTRLGFSYDERGSLQVSINGEWLWLSPEEAKKLTKWIQL
jgi:hypothetical protein